MLQLNEFYATPTKKALYFEGRYTYLVEKRFEELKRECFALKKPLNQCQMMDQAERFVDTVFEGLDETNFFEWENVYGGDIFDRYDQLKMTNAKG
jgi:hypothetical protein